MMIDTLEAVRCTQCNELHAKASADYITIQAVIGHPSANDRSRKGYLGRILGTPERPIVVCAKASCMIKALGLTEAW